MIGVIGGNGVAATNRLLTFIEEKLTRSGTFPDCHHPEMIVWQAPSRSMYLEGRGPSWIEDYVEIGRKLKDCGCTVLCMCCNTANYAIDILEKEIGLPFINLLVEVAKRAKELGCKCVGMGVYGIIAGCTDIGNAFLLAPKSEQWVCIDSLEVLACTIISKYRYTPI